MAARSTVAVEPVPCPISPIGLRDKADLAEELEALREAIDRFLDAMESM